MRRVSFFFSSSSKERKVGRVKIIREKIIFFWKKFLSSLKRKGELRRKAKRVWNISWNNYKLEGKQDQEGRVIPVLTHVSVIWSVINARNQLVSHRSCIHLRSAPWEKKPSFPFNGVSRFIFMLPSSRISAITYANNPFPIVHNADSRFIGAVIYVAERFIRRNRLAFPTRSLSLPLLKFFKNHVRDDVQLCKKYGWMFSSFSLSSLKLSRNEVIIRIHPIFRRFRR